MVPLMHQLVRYVAQVEGGEATALAHQKLGAFDVPPRESRLERFGPDDLSEIEKLAAVQPVTKLSPQVLPHSISSVHFDHWPYLVGLALALLLAELLVVQSFARNRAPPSPTPAAKGGA
jgi:hypothetical protein